AKQSGFSDRQRAFLWHTVEGEVRRARTALGVVPSYRRVDTCAAEFEAYTPYYYSTYEAPVVSVPTTEHRAPSSNGRDGQAAGEASGPGLIPHSAELSLDDETRPPAGKDRIMILGGGPNRIGQGIEFDYCCVPAAFALRGAGFESVMVTPNPETVSPDYETCDPLFFEPLTAEDVLNICDRMRPKGLIVQFGGQTPLNLARA